MKGIWRCIKGCLCIGILMCVLTACSETELEERCFPMMAAVGFDDGQVEYVLGFPSTNSSGDAQSSIGKIQVPAAKGTDFKASKENYETHLNKLVDYNHLKVLVIEEDFLEQNNAYTKMLDYLAVREEFPRNAYVCVVEDLDELMELEKELPQDIGTYLEEFLNHRGENRDKILTLGDLIDEKENQNMVLYLPYLEVEENYVKQSGYVNIRGKIWKEF